MELFVAVTVLIVIVGIFVAMRLRPFAGDRNKAEQIRAMMQELNRYQSKRHRAKPRDSDLNVASESE
jgi:uncharacterized membrane protein (DUF106 family)